MRKAIAFVLALGLAFLPLYGCREKTVHEEKDTLQIVSTIFPSYDWVREILGKEAKKADLSLLVKNGVDLHSYQPSVEDLVMISECDLFIYVGGTSDGWVEDALHASQNPDQIAVDLLQVLGLDDDTEADEHVWLSLKNAKELCTHIADQLSALDPERAQTYADNLAAYTEQLETLDVQYEKMVDNAEGDTVVFGDRFPFRYLFDDYGIHCFAAYAGCSAEAEVSFDTVITLAEKIDALGLSCILVPETSDKSLAQTILQSTKDKNQEILVLDSMQSVTEDQMEEGITYLSGMESNLAVLEYALG